MHYKLLALDIDGTLTNSEKQVTPRVLNAIERAQDAGVAIALASGRPVQGIWPVAKNLRLEERGGYILAFNGGQIVDCATGKTLCQSTLPQGAPAALCELAKSHNVNILTYEDAAIVTERPDDKYTHLEAHINNMRVRAVKDLAAHVNFPVVKCLITGDSLGAVEEEAHKRFDRDMSVMRSEPFFLEVMSHGVDKASALEKLAEHLGLTIEEFAACGDGFNDISMVARAGLGIAMANAQAPVKEAARALTLSNDEDGVAYAIEKYLLPQWRFVAAHA